MATAEPSPLPSGPSRRRLVRLAGPAVVLAIGVAVALVLALGGGSSGGAPGSSAEQEPEPDPVAVEATSVYDFSSLEELAAASDLVVRARVVHTARGELIGADGADPANAGIVVRDVTLEVNQVLRETGDPTVDDGTRLTVAEEGWLASGEPLIVDGLGPSAVGDDGVWFLQRLPDGGRYLVINSQGRYLVDRSGQGVGALRGATGDDPLVLAVEQLTPDELATALRR